MTERWTWQRLLQLAALILLSLWVLLPLAFMLVTSFKTNPDITIHPASWIPHPFTWQNYTQILHDQQNPIGRWFVNSAVVVTGAVLLVLIVASLAAYALARLDFPGRDALFIAILASTLIPGVTFLIPLFSEFARAHLLNTYWAMILVHPAGAFAVFMLRQFYLGIPREIEEAAVIDGAGMFRRWLRIILPMTQAPLLTLAILTAVGVYNDFLWPLVVAQSQNMYTITVGISIVTTGAYVNNFGPLMAFSAVAALPSILLFVILQRYFVASAALTGVKG